MVVQKGKKITGFTVFIFFFVNCNFSDGGVHLMFITKEKKEELDALLSRAQTALENLQKIFFTFTGKITITYRYLRDVIAIYKRCQDLEKILKSHFFEEEELAKLLEEIKLLMYDEKRNELNDRLLKIYEKRKSGGRSESPEKEDSSASVSQASEDTAGQVFSETNKPDSSNSELTQLANAIVQSVMKTFTASQVQNQESSAQEGANLQNGDSHDVSCSATSTEDSLLNVTNNDDKSPSPLKPNSNPECCQMLEECSNGSPDKKELSVSQESGLEVSDCDSGLGESKGSGASLDKETWVSKQRKKEELCKRFCQLMLIQMVKVRYEIGQRWENTKPWMEGAEPKQTDKPEESQGAKLVEGEISKGPSSD
jgi:hypothetical protein